MPVTKIEYHSPALQRKSRSWVIIPEGVNRFPVLYLLHGLPDRPEDWLRRSPIASIAASLPLAIIIPEGGGLYCGAWERYLVEDIPRIMENRIEVIPKRECRGVAGISIGGYGALKIAFKHPERYGSVSCHSGAVGWGHRPLEGEGSWKELLHHQGGWLFGGGLPYRLAMKAPFRKYLSAYKRLESMRCKENDLYEIAASSFRMNPPKISLDCGTDDFLKGDNQEFHSFLSERGVEHDYREYPGAHNWNYWNARMSEMLNFHARSMNLIK